MSKKKPTDAPAYGSYSSYQLTDEQVKAALSVFQFDMLEADDERAAMLLAVLRSFTYTTENSDRENMLLAAEAVLIPQIGAAYKAVDQLTIKAHQQLIREGGVQ
jgi:hypothetical protein